MSDEKTFQDLVNERIAGGANVHSPNGLPLKCVMSNGDLYEHEHGDHPTYMFPVEVEFVGKLTEAHRDDFGILMGFATGESDKNNATDDDVRHMFGETHALIYTDGCIMHGSLWKSGGYRLSEASIEAIKKDRL